MNLIKTTQTIMPRPRDDYFKDFDKFESLLSGIPVEGITDYENDRLTSSLCQLFIEKYNEEITDEHAKNYKPVQKRITLVLIVFLSMVEDGLPHTSEGCDITSFCDSCISGMEALRYDSVSERLNNAIESVHFESNEWLRLMQFALAFVAGGVTVNEKPKLYPMVNFFFERLIESEDDAKAIDFSRCCPSTMRTMLPNIRLHILLKTLNDFCKNILQEYTARIYCNLWFAKNREERNFAKDIEARRQFVLEHIKCCPMDGEFILLSLTFSDEIMMGREVSLLR